MRKDYKQNAHEWRMGKRGQISIFVIIALVIVVVAVVYLLMRSPRLEGDDERATPHQFLSSCLESSVQPILAELGAQAGMTAPEGFIVYNESKVPYLCYTSEYYKPCVVQQPDVLGAFESSLSGALQEEAERCMKEFEAAYERRGYSVARAGTRVNASFTPGKLQVQLRAPVTMNKEVSRTYQTFDLSYASQYYDLASIATSILDYESSYGDSETTTYLQYYPDLKIQKIKLSDGSKIYRVSNVVSKEEFTFATRSLAWGAGYPAQ